MKKQLLSILTIFIFLFATQSCKKYEDGPTISINTKKGRLSNTWKIDQFLSFGEDSTQFYADSGSFMQFEKDGNAMATIYRSNDLGGDTSNYTGTWEFAEKKEAIVLYFTDEETQVLDTSAYWIRRLKKKELWLETDETEFGLPDGKIILSPM